MGTKNYDSATDMITFSRASSATFLGSNGLLQTSANNIPRIEYDAAGAVKGLLIEEARTNVALYSEDFTQGYWEAYGAVTTTGNVAVAPDGNLTADRIAAKSASATNGAFTLAAVPTGGCVSVFAKADTVDWLGFGQAGSCWAYFDLANGVTGNKSTTVGYTSITAYPNGWYLCQAWGITISWSRVDTSGVIRNNITASDGATTCSIGDSLSLYGAQLELGAFPTSYIPTTGAAATRAVDLAEIPTSAFGYNSGAGTVVVEFDTKKPSGQGYGSFALSDNTASNRVIHATNLSGVSQTAYVATSNVGQVNMSAGNYDASSGFAKFSLAVKENNFGASLNGASTVTDILGTLSPEISTLGLGYFYPGAPSTNLINGHIKSIQYYPRRLTNAQLQELTT